jgi:hypothetical protein
VDLFRYESAGLHTYWVLVVIDHWTRRIVGFGVHRGVVDGVALCRMFNRATRGQSLPTYLSADHDPLYRFHQWQANLRILNIREIKTVPSVPRSHSVVERLIGTVRRECLDRLLFWTAADLERKLAEFQQYYNEHRTHAGRDGRPPARRASTRPAPTRVSGRIDGSRTVVAYITRQKPRDAVDSQRIDSNDLRIRHSQAPPAPQNVWCGRDARPSTTLPVTVSRPSTSTSSAAR